jgi:hypothetical protein
VVFPLARLLARWRVLSAVVIGSMVPDFRVFYPWPLARFETHSLTALFTFCLPVGLLTYWIFQFLIKPSLAEILPDPAYVRWQPFAAPAPLLSLRSWLLAACGVLFGAMTHVALDAFTHDGARGVRMFPALDEPLFDIGHRHIVATRVMQDLGSLFGLMLVLAVVWFGLRRGAQAQASPARLLSGAERQRWVVAYLAAALLFSVAAYVGAQDPDEHRIVAHIYESAVAVLRGLAAAGLGVSLALYARLKELR